MRSSCVRWAPLLLLGCLSAYAVGAVERPAPRIDFEAYRLPNGLQVVLSEDDRLPLVAVNMRYAVGSANDPPGRTGLAHLFEHLFSFARLQGFDESPITLLQRAGATQASAVTSPDRTTYFTTIPSSQLELALAVEAERMHHFAPTLEPALFAREQAIVRNERRLNVEGRPYGLADEAVFASAFPEGHPYHHRYIGSHADIEATQIADAREFFARYYRPGNAILSVAGDLDKRQVKEWVAKYFGAVPAGAAPPPLPAKIARIPESRRVLVTDQIELPRLTMTWLTPPGHAPGDAEMSLLPFLLGGSEGSLHVNLVEQRRLAQSVVVEYLPYALGSVVTIKATAHAGVTLEALETALETELAARLEAGWNDEQIDRARRKIELRILRGLEKLGDITSHDDSSAAIPYGGVADHLGECLHAFANPDCLPQTLGRYGRVTSATLNDTLRKTLTRHSRVVVHAVPGEKVVNDVPARNRSVEQSKPPQSHEPGARSLVERELRSSLQPNAKVQLPAPRQFTLSNGLTVLLLERRQLPVIRAALFVRAGSVASAGDQPGLASFAVDMLLRGTQRRSAKDVASYAEQLGTVVEADVGSDTSALGISVLKESLEPAMLLLAELATQPTFSQSEIDKLRADRRAQLALELNDPGGIASRRFTELLFGASSPYRHAGLLNDGMFVETPPYGYDALGSDASLQTLTRARLVNFWKSAYTPRNSVLVVAGDVAEAELRVLAENHFGKWRGRAAQVMRPPTVAAGAGSETMILIDRGPASQTVLRIGAAVGSPPGGADYVPLRLANIIFGEIFSSRITRNLRERHGYTYLVRSQLAQRREPGQVFVISTSVRTDATAAAVQELFNELRRIANEPVAPEELASARNTFMSSVTARFEVSSDVATALGQLHSLQLPLDYYQSLAGEIAAVTASDIQRVALRYFSVANMRIVALGDRSKIEQPLRALGLGPMRVE